MLKKKKVKKKRRDFLKTILFSIRFLTRQEISFVTKHLWLKSGPNRIKSIKNAHRSAQNFLGGDPALVLPPFVPIRHSMVSSAVPLLNTQWRPCSLCNRRLQPPRDVCAVRVRWFSSVILWLLLKGRICSLRVYEWSPFWKWTPLMWITDRLSSLPLVCITWSAFWLRPCAACFSHP